MSAADREIWERNRAIVIRRYAEHMLRSEHRWAIAEKAAMWSVGAACAVLAIGLICAATVVTMDAWSVPERGVMDQPQ